MPNPTGTGYSQQPPNPAYYGSVVIDFRHKDFKCGEYAVVCPADGKAYKIFRSRPEVPPRRTREGRRRVYESQCEAYELASGDDFLRRHVPRYFGAVAVEDVIGPAGVSLKEDFLLDCCYATELLEGPELKVTDSAVIKDYAHIAVARERFRNRGIRTSDASVFSYDDPESFKIIDFEMDH